MNKAWPRVLAEEVAKMPEDYQSRILRVFEGAPPIERRKFATGYVIARIDQITHVGQIPSELEPAVEAGILMKVKGSPVKGLPYYRAVTGDIYIPTNLNTENPDRQAAAILRAALRKHRQLQAQESKSKE